MYSASVVNIATMVSFLNSYEIGLVLYVSKDSLVEFRSVVSAAQQESEYPCRN